MLSCFSALSKKTVTFFGNKKGKQCVLYIFLYRLFCLNVTILK